MCSGLALFVGIFLLLRGQLVINNRVIPPKRTRLIALILMSPFVIGLIAGMLMVTPGSTISFDTLQNAAFIELIALIIAFVLVVYLVTSTPPSETKPYMQQHPLGQPTPMQSMPTRVPDILTVAEAAAYLRVSEAEVMRLIDEGKLAAARIGDSYRIARIAIDDFMQSDPFR